MIPKKLSSFRLQTTAAPTARYFQLSSQLFHVLKSKNSGAISQFYIVDSNWKKITSGQVIPLAHVILSNATGKMQFNILQPEVFDLEISNTKLQKLLEILLHDIHFGSDSTYCYN
ncbi:MAG: hypothetical protein WBP46_12910 [Thiolinea sp.]